MSTPGTTFSETTLGSLATPATPATNTESPLPAVPSKAASLQVHVNLPSPGLPSSIRRSPPRQGAMDATRAPTNAFAARLGVDMYPQASPKPTGDMLKRLDTIASGPFAGGFKREVARTPSPELFRRNMKTIKRTNSDRSEDGHPISNIPRSSSPQEERSESPVVALTETPVEPSVVETSDLKVESIASAHPSADIDRLLEELQNDNHIETSQEPTATKTALVAPSLATLETEQEPKSARKPVPLKLSHAPRRSSKFDQPLRSAGLGTSANPFQWIMSQEPLTQRMSRGRASSISTPSSPFTSPPMPSIPLIHRPLVPQRSYTNDSSHSSAKSSSSTFSHVSTKSSFSNAGSMSSKSSWSSVNMSRRPSNCSRDGHDSHEVKQPTAEPNDLAVRQDLRINLPLPKVDQFMANSPESPMDPAIQWGSLPPLKTQLPSASRDTATSAGTTPAQSALPTIVGTPTLNSSPVQMFSDSPPPLKPRSPHRLAKHENPALLSPNIPQQRSKGNCRGCSQPIYGKSIRAADGRLTGRYHHQCFSCKTCARPFPDASFYVHNDSPYCAQHWHQINGSLCRKCHQGIEGHYLATDRGEKFHTSCFSCTTCNVPLREDYFEMSGRAYCERHAFDFARRGVGAGAERAARLGPNVYGNYGSYGGPVGGYPSPERRRTRLMMM